MNHWTFIEILYTNPQEPLYKGICNGKVVRTYVLDAKAEYY